MPVPYANPQWPADISDIQLGSMLFPHLFLGCVNAVCADPDPFGGVEFLRARRVTHILTVAAEPETMPDVAALEKALGRPLGWISVPEAWDSPECLLIEGFERANSFIDAALRPYFQALAEHFVAAKWPAKAPRTSSRIVGMLAAAPKAAFSAIAGVPGAIASVPGAIAQVPGAVTGALGAVPGAIASVPGAIASVPGAIAQVPGAVGGVLSHGAGLVANEARAIAFVPGAALDNIQRGFKVITRVPDSADKILPPPVEITDPDVLAAVDRGMPSARPELQRAPDTWGGQLAGAGVEALRKAAEDILHEPDHEDDEASLDARKPDLAPSDTTATISEYAEWQNDVEEFLKKPYKVADMPDSLGAEGENYPVVLIHCQMGISRSATVATAYLMWLSKRAPLLARLLTGVKGTADFQEALGYIHRRRPVAHPNAGFRYQLKVWGAMGCEIDKESPAWKYFYARQRIIAEELRKRLAELDEQKNAGAGTKSHSKVVM
ncbi:hypothetical protein DFJ74DRAFT_732972 [Hyaloraphidium curvatum]|nr:hypothetical protein DFJ74DRAFT_732972 [Hyaloraphidium curvatum]